MKVGIIGTGNMGTILSEAFLDGKAVSPANLIATNRTRAKAESLKENYEGITIVDNVPTLIAESDLVFLCVKPLDIHALIIENKALFTKDKCLVSITSPIQVPWLEEIVPCSCARIIPSITNRALSGISLVTYGTNCEGHWQEKLNAMFSAISAPVQINENITRISSDIVSCGPAFFSYLARRFIEAAVAKTQIDVNTATELTEQMLIGVGDLLKKGYYTLPALEEKVCVKGGITGEGIKVLEQETGDMFEKIFEATHKKFDDEVAIIKAKFNP